MGLQLIVGKSGYGKTTFLCNEAINKAIENADSNVYVIVPEQFTMAIQKRIVSMSPRKGILNIDVVSFERLAYKVFEEVGGENRPVLDDTGKNLIIRHVLETQKNKLEYFGSIINKTGFITELKSVISEFLQYGVTQNTISQVLEHSGDNKQLSGKLKDIGVVYTAFKDYMESKYITSEEILDVLCSVINKSDKIKNAELLFDGFTGFTPIQYKLLNLLLINAKEIKVSICADPNEKLNICRGMNELFFMSKEMIRKLYEICDESHIRINEPVLLNNPNESRFKKSSDLSFIENNLFRYKHNKYAKNPDNITVYEATTPKDEIKYVAGEIIRLTREGGYRYRDIAVVNADMATYGRLTANIMQQNEIPYFLDMKRSVADNPYIEFIRGALEVLEDNYSYDSVFRYLRTGMTGISNNDIDILENYCLALGLRGRKGWTTKWTRNLRKQYNKVDLDKINDIRMSIVEPLTILEQAFRQKGANVRQYVTALYEFIVNMQCPQKIDELSSSPQTGNEYDQLYRKTIELFDKLVELLGDEKISIKEFSKILDAGFEEIKVGLIPPSLDSILIGDIERTRLDDIKVLFFIGVNDGVVPAKQDSKSILSQADRGTLEKLKVTLSPSVKEKAFIQRFYLYMILTKAEEKLYISYARKALSGKVLMPSYLIQNIRFLFPSLQLSYSEMALKQLSYIRIPKNDISWSSEDYIKELGENIAQGLYKNELNASISSFEKYAACRFAYFLQYGLQLEEREQFGFEYNDFGNVIHIVLEQIMEQLMAEKKVISDLSDEQRYEMVKNCVNMVADEYNNTILKESKRNEFLIKRITDMADRTIWAVGKQLACGKFRPAYLEKPFLVEEKDVYKGKGIAFRGKIDRVDIYEDDENVYVKVVDYKSGGADYKLALNYYGLQLQLIMYLKSIMDLEQKKNPKKNIIPAGILYYNIDDPMVESDSKDFDVDGQLITKNIEDKILKLLKTKGLVNDDKRVIDYLDEERLGYSIPVSYKKDGTLKKSGTKACNTERFTSLKKFTECKVRDMTSSIYNGCIEINPVKDKLKDVCKYCPFSAVCGHSQDLINKDRRIAVTDDTVLWNNIKEGVDENGKKLDEGSKESN